MIQLQDIGYIKSSFNEKADPFLMKEKISSVVVNKEFEEGLYDIESNRYIQILFHFHLSDSYKLKGRWYFGDEKGVFASRSPNRPGAVGVTTVRLLERNGNVLKVEGLDAVNGTPVIDIKPFIPHHDAEFSDCSEVMRRKPRAYILPLLKNRKTHELFLESGKLHGHYCPGLAMGVVASVEGLNLLAEKCNIPVSLLNSSEGMEELISIIEINSCFADGIQYVSGCTLGNNALLYRDYGKTAVTFCIRDGRGVRLSSNGKFHEILNKVEPRFQPVFEEVIKKHSRDPEKLKKYKEVAMDAGSAMCGIAADEIFTITEVSVDLPDYAPIRESVTCSSCGESLMGGKQASGDPPLCIPCSDSQYLMLDGNGLRRSDEK